MKIGVDAGCLGITDPQLQVGVYQVAKNLLVQLGKIDTKNEYFLYSFVPIEKQVLSEFGNCMRNIVVKPSKGWNKVWLPVQLAKDKPDIFLGLSQSLPAAALFSSYKSIAFLYDLAFETYPDMYPDSYEKLHNQTNALIKHAPHIITISQATKEAIIASDLSEDKISVVYPGVRDVVFPKDSGPSNLAGEQAGMTPIKSGRPYFLFVGALKRIKNVPTLLKAFAHFFERSKKEYDLVLIGGKKWFDTDIEVVLQEMPEQYRKHIQFLGFVDDATMAAYYQGATAFVSPSLYEGFGLPFVEAMAAGCPVIGSNAGAIPEVVSDAGILVDPLDVTGLANAMERVSAYTSLRLKMKEAGIKRAKHFSWETFAQGVLEIINTV